MKHNLATRHELTTKKNYYESARKVIVFAMVNALFPFVIYLVMKNVFQQADFPALVATAIPPTITSLISLIRHRRLDFLAILILSGIAIGLLLALLGHTPRILLIRESFFTGILGLTFLISLFFPRPLIYYMERTIKTGNDAKQIEQFAQKLQDPSYHRELYVQTSIWGFALFLQAITCTLLAFMLPSDIYLMIAPFLQWGLLGIAFLLSRADKKLRQKRLTAARTQ